MTRYIAVKWETQTVFSETFTTKQAAWKAVVEHERKHGGSGYEWDIIEISVEAQ